MGLFSGVDGYMSIQVFSVTCWAAPASISFQFKSISTVALNSSATWTLCAVLQAPAVSIATLLHLCKEHRQTPTQAKLTGVRLPDSQVFLCLPDSRVFVCLPDSRVFLCLPDSQVLPPYCGGQTHTDAPRSTVHLPPF